MSIESRKGIMGLSEGELGDVSGGNFVDRSMVLNEIRKSGYGDYIINGDDNEDTLNKTCSRFNISYTANTFCCDEFEFDGHKFSSSDLLDSDNRKILEDYIKKQL